MEKSDKYELGDYDTFRKHLIILERTIDIHWNNNPNMQKLKKFKKVSKVDLVNFHYFNCFYDLQDIKDYSNSQFLHDILAETKDKIIEFVKKYI